MAIVEFTSQAPARVNAVSELAGWALYLIPAITAKPPHDTFIAAFSRRIERNQAPEPLTCDIFGAVLTDDLFLPAAAATL
jgi:hypothetical protein